MATNFEFYKDEILKCLSENNIAIKDNKPVKCVGDCNSCIRDSEIGICMDKPLFEWLYAEHIEPPKLTKRERAFCEAMQTGWIAKDCNMHLFYFSGKPELKQGTWMTRVGQHCRIKGIEDAFMFIKDTDSEPWAVADLLKLEVIEEVQEDA